MDNDVLSDLLCTEQSGSPSLRRRAMGCMMGLLCGDALGSPLEFKGPKTLADYYPNGVDTMVPGWDSTRNRKVGQITDDGEMALCLLHSLAAKGAYDADNVLRRYRNWLKSQPIDVGNTISYALVGVQNAESEANGALMRVAPIAIKAAADPGFDWQDAAAQDAALTHINPVCAHANIIYVESVMLALKGEKPKRIYAQALARAEELKDDALLKCLRASATAEPAYYPCAGWVLIAMQCTYYWLLHAVDYPTAMLAIVNKLGDPDTNGAIAGALLGALFGVASIPLRWRQLVLAFNARPKPYLAASSIPSLLAILA